VLLTVTLSGGVAALQPGDDASALVQRADAALYRSKQAGRDRVTRA
jgi:diguanylate cyclase